MFSRAVSEPPDPAASASFHEPTVVTQIVMPLVAFNSARHSALLGRSLRICVSDGRSDLYRPCKLRYVCSTTAAETDFAADALAAAASRLTEPAGIPT